MTTGSTFALLIDGERYSGWQSIRVTRGLERASADFALAVSSREPWPIFTGAACEIYVDGDLLLTGWVDAYRPQCSATEHRIEVTGRSKTCDFVDSSVTLDGGQLTGLTVQQVAETLGAPFNLVVVADEAGEPVPEVQVQPSETCFQVVERLARLQELLVTDNAAGALVLTRAGNTKSETALIFGVNVHSATANMDDSHRFSDYIVKAQRPGNRTADKKIAKGKTPDWPGIMDLPAPPPSESIARSSADDTRALWRMRLLRPDPRATMEDGDNGDGDGWEDADGDGAPGNWGGGTDDTTDRGIAVITQVVGTAKDPGITRYRPRVIVAEAQADDDNAEKRADWERRRRIANAMKATVQVTGWRQGNGDLWATNLMVYCRIPWIGLDRELITSEVEFSISEDGEMTTLSLTLPDAFLPKRIRPTKVVSTGTASAPKTKAKGKGPGVNIWAGAGR